jgi:hypothetical protein
MSVCPYARKRSVLVTRRPSLGSRYSLPQHPYVHNSHLYVALPVPLEFCTLTCKPWEARLLREVPAGGQLSIPMLIYRSGYTVIEAAHENAQRHH